MKFSLFIKRLPIALAGTLLLSQGHALVALEEEEMADVSGAGLAFVFDNFSMRMAPTSFIELTGTAPQGVGWQRGDARYYGLSITNGAQTGGTDWYGNGCNTGSSVAGALGCPIGNSNSTVGAVTANQFGVGTTSSIYDPYLIRVFQYPGHDYAGNYLSTTANMPTILELVGPSYTDTWRWSFWGELEVNRNVGQPSAANGAVNCASGGANCATFLQNQTIIRGKPTVADVDGDGRPEPAIFRLMRTTGLAAGENTLGLTYQSALSGDFRFSVAQKSNSPDQLHYVPDFNDVEGMYFKNVDAFLPLGTLHYQTLILDAAGTSGNFTIELTAIPNNPLIYNHFYCGGISQGATNFCDPNNDGQIDNPNNLTRGHIRWGNWAGVNVATGVGLPSATSTTNGVYYVNSDEITPVVTNLGISRIEGMRIHSLKITTLGAGI